MNNYYYKYSLYKKKYFNYNLKGGTGTYKIKVNTNVTNYEGLKDGL